MRLTDGYPDGVIVAGRMRLDVHVGEVEQDAVADRSQDSPRADHAAVVDSRVVRGDERLPTVRSHIPTEAAYTRKQLRTKPRLPATGPTAKARPTVPARLQKAKR